MKLLMRSSLAVAVMALVGLALIPANPVLAQSAVAFSGNSVAEINIRSAPGVNASSIGILPAGEKVTAIGRNLGNNWIQIQFATTTGWVASWLTVYSGDTVLLPVITDDTPEPSEADKAGPFIVTSPFNVNVRSDPDIDSRVLTIMPFTGQATAIGRTDESNWVHVKYNTVTGWVAKWRVLLNADITALPIDSGSFTPSNPTTPSVPKATSTPGGPPATPAGPPTSLPQGGITIQAPSRANVRAAPSIEASILDIVSFTDEVVAVGRTAGNNWLQVSANGTTGWVARWVVLASDDTVTLPVTSSSTEITPSVGGAVAGKGIYDVFIRTGPSVNNGQVAVLPAYTQVPFVARTEDSSWIRVDFNGVTGWVASWVMVGTADFNNLPVETP